MVWGHRRCAIAGSCTIAESLRGDAACCVSTMAWCHVVMENTPAVCPYTGGLGCRASVLVAGFVGAGQVVLPGCPVGAGHDVDGGMRLKGSRIALFVRS